MVIYSLDINECLTNNGGCNQTCTNEVGSYHCDCQEGLELRDDLHDCLGIHIIYIFNYIIFHIGSFIDINECNSNNGGCEHSCMNTLGSYYCTCNSGYSLDSNEFNCTGKDSFKPY